MSDTFAKAFNNWMDDYTKNPLAYKSTADAAIKHLREKLDGREPSYGEECAAVFRAYLSV